MYKLCKKIENLVPYAPIEGDYKVRLDANESFIEPSAEFKAKILKAISEVEFTRYPDPVCKTLRASVADYYKINMENVVIGNGSDELIGILINSFLEKGDTMLTVAPDFSMYGFYGHLAEVNVVNYQKPEDFKLADLSQTMKLNNVKLVIFSNPCNPTGELISKEEVREFIKSTDALVILDEAYMDFSTESLINEATEYDNLIILRTASKAFGMASIRLGIAVANTVLATAISASKSPYNVNSLTQVIGTLLFKEETNIDKLIATREYLREELLNLFPNDKVYSSDTNFVFVKTDRTEEIFAYLLTQSIKVRSFKTHLRITAGSMEECEILVKTLKEYMV